MPDVPHWLSIVSSIGVLLAGFWRFSTVVAELRADIDGLRKELDEKRDDLKKLPTLSYRVEDLERRVLLLEDHRRGE